ncbi:MAG: aminopeptidase P family protein [Acetobacter sp.]|nr:aminopeptidase P family protein [Acetobacter sp.]
MSIKDIQEKLKKDKLDGYFLTLGNMFINEDILPEENYIQKLTGFTGSYALLFIAPTKAYLFVDGRYELQAKKEVNLRQIEIVKLAEISFTDWLKKNFNKTIVRLNYNPWNICQNTLESLQKLLPKAEFIPLNEPNKLLSPQKVKVFSHQKKFTGATTKEKLSLFCNYIKKQKLDAYLITAAASSSWLLNLRSNALPYTPLFRAYVLVEKSGTYKIFAEHTDCKDALSFDKLKEILPQYAKLGIDFATAPAMIKNIAPSVINTPDKVIELKAIKNLTELKGSRAAHLRDGIALTKFMYWLSKNYKDKTETDIADKLLNFRQKEPNFYSESFATIAGFGANGAIVHYHACKEKAATLKKGSTLLLDSGGQYFDGTTDVTRTIAIGIPTAEMIEKNTLVLKGHIALASAVFHQNTSGNELDLLAREPLLKQGLDYEHGTGHGVGYFSDVHEGPARISIHAKHSAPLKAGMITSIEPGYYKENAFGIRIENLYYVKPTKNPKFLQFEVLTLAPLDKQLINKYLLSTEELKWLNHYHRQVFLSLKKYLTKQELEWLKDACAPL